MSENSFVNFWLGAAGQIKKLRSLTGAGILAAVGTVLKFVSVPVGELLRISFTFLTTAIAGFMYGPLVAGMAAVVVDILGFLIRPTGAYFIGFTVSAFADGIIYGCWLWNRPVKLWRTLCACATSTVIISFLLNPMWLQLMYGKAFLAVIAARIPTNLVLLPINTAMLFFLLKVLEPQKAKLAGAKSR